jgi:hypothetical protein
MKKVWLFIILSLILAFTMPMETAFAESSNESPSITILNPTNYTTFYESTPRGGIGFQVKYQTNNTLSWVGYSIDDASNVTVSGNSTYYGGVENDGYHTLTLYANDTYGNWATPQTITYNVIRLPDTSPFLITIVAIIISVAVVIALSVALLFYKRHRRTVSLNK